jgi:hypothetical protein
MDEIAATLAESGLPPGFHEACRRRLPSLVTVA